MAAGWGSNTWGETGWGKSLYDDSRSETLALSDAYSVVVTLPFTITESFSLSDVARFVHVTHVVEAVALADTLRSNTTWAHTVLESVTFDDSMSQRLLWEPIDDTQAPDWTLINTRP